MTYEDVIKRIEEIRNFDSNMWSLYFLGTQICIGKSRIYVHEGMARRKFLEDMIDNLWWEHQNASWRNGTSIRNYTDFRKEVKNEVEPLIKEMERVGILEFRKLGDRSPRFPWNVNYLEKEQADKFAKMIDSGDQEMKNLARIMLEQLKTKENGSTCTYKEDTK